MTTNTREEDFEMTQIAKNNGDNLLFGDEDNCKGWPQVGDEILTYSNQKAVVKAVDGEFAWIKYEKEALCYSTQNVCTLKKPPTPEEDLESELRVFINIEAWESCKDLSKAIINGEIKGLSYKPQ